MRNEGAGHFLGRTIEAETIESLALSGGVTSVLAIIEILLSGVVLTLGAAGIFHPVLLAAWMLLTLVLTRRYFRIRSDWTVTRLMMTDNLVERMNGHRTRLAQQAAAEWHVDEDQAMENYIAQSARMDRANANLTGLVANLWLLTALTALIPAFVFGQPSARALAISIGGLILAWRAFRRLTLGLSHVAGAAISWKQVAPLFHAAARRGEAGASINAKCGKTVLEIQDLTFSHPGRTQPVLDGINLEVRPGERILLEGESGSGNRRWFRF